MHTDVKRFCITKDASIQEAVARAESNRLGIVLVVDDGQRLIGTITDGDVRRAILANISSDEPVGVLLASKAGTSYARPITAPVETDSNTLLHVLQQNAILYLPLVDQEQRVVALVTLDEFVAKQEPPLQAVIMAGGAGVRLRPLTDEMPKPMLPIGDRPLMEFTVRQLRDSGIKHLNVAVHHKSEKITEYFGDGREFGVDISYVTEDRPLGTAGALGLMEPPQDTMLVINGDILTQVDFRAMQAYHREQKADITVAVQKYELQVPYGVIECEGTQVRGLSEKPIYKYFVNAGIYLLEPMVYKFIPNGQRYDMTDLIQRVVEEGRMVVAFPVKEYWIDVGQKQDYQQAQEHAKKWEPAG